MRRKSKVPCDDVRAHTQTHTHTRTYELTHTQACTLPLFHIYTLTHTHTHLHTLPHTHTFTCIHTYLHTSSLSVFFSLTHIYAHIQIHTHLHTHTHTHINTHTLRTTGSVYVAVGMMRSPPHSCFSSLGKKELTMMNSLSLSASTPLGNRRSSLTTKFRFPHRPCNCGDRT